MDQTIFEGMIGYHDIKLELLRLLDQLQQPEKYRALAVDKPRGLLLHGQPGVGKSTLAQCFLKACGRPGFVCRKDKPNGDFVNEIVRIFDEAAAAAPSVVLLDDLDKFSKEQGHRRDAEEFVTVQACIDRVREQDVFVVATANSLQKLPESLYRAGRFDCILNMACPKGEDLEEIVSHYLSQKPYVGTLNVRRIARLLEGSSCAQLEQVVNLAGTYAAFEGRSQVLMEDMVKAIQQIIFHAPEKTNASEAGLELIACHEAGHTLIAELLEPDSVDLVSVLTCHSDTAGVTSLHRDEQYFHSKHLMEVRVMCLLAGKAATEICHGTTDTGCISDLRRAFRIVHRFVDDYCSFGFDRFVFDERPSNEVLARRDAQVASELDRYYQKTRQLLVENRSKLDALIKKLLEEKTLLGEQIQEILRCA